MVTLSCIFFTLHCTLLAVPLQEDASKDKRFDVCLYFISPHRYRGIDVDYVAALRKYVNVIPIIAKSDTMSVKELKQFRPTILSSARRHGSNANMDFFR